MFLYQYNPLIHYHPRRNAKKYYEKDGKAKAPAKRAPAQQDSQGKGANPTKSKPKSKGKPKKHNK